MRHDLNDSAFHAIVCHHLDRVANPDSASAAKTGTFESIKRMGELWVFCGRGFDTLPVLLFPGIVGKQLPLQLKSLNAQLWKIYESTALPTAFTNMLCLASSTMGWGGRPNDPAWILGAQYLPTWTPAEPDKFKAPSDWTLESPKPHSLTLETWRRNAPNQSLVFALIYGGISGTDLPHLQPRREAIEKLYRLHLSRPDKYTLEFIVEIWGQLNARWVETLKESSNRLCLLRKVERPTFEELEETGMRLDPHGRNIFAIPDTFSLADHSGFFQHQLLGALERDFDRARRGQYYKIPANAPNRNAGTEAKIPPHLINNARSPHLRPERTEDCTRGRNLLGLQ